MFIFTILYISLSM